MRIRVRLLANCDRRLAFCKILKEYTGLGLKEAKDLMDDIEDKFRRKTDEYVEFDIISSDKLMFFKEALISQDILLHIIGGKEWIRELRLLSLVGDKEDTLRFIEDNISINHNISNRIIKLAFDKLSNSDVIELLNEISKEFNFDEL